MFRSVWEIVTDVKPVLPENAYPRMETTEVGMVTAARLLLLNAAPRGNERETHEVAAYRNFVDPGFHRGGR